MTQIIQQPFGNKDAKRHYDDTVATPVPLNLIQQYLSPDDYTELARLDISGSVPVWGVTPGTTGGSVAKWERVSPGDVVLFSSQRVIRSTARVLFKVQSKALAERLWGFDPEGQTWEYIYFLTDLKQHDIRIEDFNEAAGYAPNNNIQGFNVLSEEKSAGILARFDDFAHSITSAEPDALPVTAVRPLERFQQYSRAEVHRVFSPQTKFTERAGAWGLRGIVAIPNRQNDYIFFVNYSKSTGEELEESISESGIVTWHSQPAQSLVDKQIQSFIDHNESINSIYLFLRRKKGEKYTFLGKLKYLSHNRDTQNPVWFKWEILDWNEQSKVALRDQDFQLSIDTDVVEATSATSTSPINPEDVVLTEVTAPTQERGRAEPTRKFKGRKRDYAAQDRKNRDLGLQGELIVLAHEKRILIEAGHPDLAEMVQHTSVIEGDGAGYDIHSYDVNGKEKRIEVKSTRGGIESDFFLSANEVAFSEHHSASFYLYRLCDLKGNVAKVYIHHGSLKGLELQPTEYKVANLKVMSEVEAE